MAARYDTTPPDADWRARWATSPFNPATSGNASAATLELHARLLGLGGWAACMRDPSLPAILLARGSEAPGKDAEMRIGRPCDCHENSRELADGDPTLIVHYGYALSSDGMWREHSWCVKPDGGIVETTVARTAYFGAPDRG